MRYYLTYVDKIYNITNNLIINIIIINKYKYIPEWHLYVNLSQPALHEELEDQ